MGQRFPFLHCLWTPFLLEFTFDHQCLLYSSPSQTVTSSAWNTFRKYCSRNWAREKSAWFPCPGGFWVTYAWGALLCLVSHSYRCQGFKQSFSGCVWGSWDAKGFELYFLHHTRVCYSHRSRSTIYNPLYFSQFPSLHSLPRSTDYLKSGSMYALAC